MATGNLTTYLIDRIGQDLRGVVEYDEMDTITLHLRDDIQNSRVQDQIDQILQRLKSETERAEEAAFQLGDLHVSVRCFEDAVILHFPTGREEGVVVSVEPSVASDLTSFARTCSLEIAR